MSLQRGIDGAEPVRPQALERAGGLREERRSVREWRLGTGTLACPACDAPVAPGPHGLRPAAPVSCPFCHHGAAAREFLSLGAPERPARVAVHVVHRR